jgi:hypothetical protein
MSTSATHPSPSGRPGPGEYASYASEDIAAVPGDDAIQALTWLAAETTALFRLFRESADRGLTYAPGKWTVKEVLGHIVDDERIFACRLLCVARGEEGELPGFDENGYAAHADSSIAPWTACWGSMPPCGRRRWCYSSSCPYRRGVGVVG